MFIINLTYKVALGQVEQHLEAHIDFLNSQYQIGTFLASGRKVPRDGGIILARAESKEAIEAVVQQDPFVSLGIAAYTIVEFEPSKTSKELEVLLEQKINK